jgi:LysR family nitrogen assimilation transcriptional regulator
MELKQLEYFRHVAELGSFTRAAAFLSVVQPALSRQVRQLEIELGQNLFDRNGRGVVLTDAGTRLLEHTRGILTQIGRARQDLEDQRAGDAGHIALGLPPSLGSSLTVPLVKAFKRSLPNASLATVEGLSAYMVEWLGVGRVDCALVYNATASSSMHLQPVLDDPLYLIGPASGVGATHGLRADAVTLTELAAYPLIMPNRPHAMRMAVENALAGVDRKIRIAHEIESIPAIVDLVAEGHGFGVLPLNAIRATQWASQVVVKPIECAAETPLTISLSIATSAQRPRSPLMRRSIELIRDIVESEVRRARMVSAAPRAAEAV